MEFTLPENCILFFHVAFKIEELNKQPEKNEEAVEQIQCLEMGKAHEQSFVPRKYIIITEPHEDTFKTFSY